MCCAEVSCSTSCGCGEDPIHEILLSDNVILLSDNVGLSVTSGSDPCECLINSIILSDQPARIVVTHEAGLPPSRSDCDSRRNARIAESCGLDLLRSDWHSPDR